jgi:hypothetical protein
MSVMMTNSTTPTEQSSLPRPECNPTASADPPLRRHQNRTPIRGVRPRQQYTDSSGPRLSARNRHDVAGEKPRHCNGGALLSGGIFREGELSQAPGANRSGFGEAEQGWTVREQLRPRRLPNLVTDQGIVAAEVKPAIGDHRLLRQPQLDARIDTAEFLVASGTRLQQHQFAFPRDRED